MTREEKAGGSGRRGFNQPSALPLTVEIPMRTTKLSDLPPGASETMQYLERNLPPGVTGTITFAPTEPSPGLAMLIEHLEDMKDLRAKIERIRNAKA